RTRWARPATERRRGPEGRAEFGRHHARPPARRGGPGRWRDRRLAGPRPRARPGRGRRPWRPSRLARRPPPRPPQPGPLPPPPARVGLVLGAAPPPPPAAGTAPAKVAARLSRLAAPARRAETLLVALEPPGLTPGLATAVAESTGLRLELRRTSWIRLGRDV